MPALAAWFLLYNARFSYMVKGPRHMLPDSARVRLWTAVCMHEGRYGSARVPACICVCMCPCL